MVYVWCLRGVSVVYVWCMCGVCGHVRGVRQLFGTFVINSPKFSFVTSVVETILVSREKL